MSHMMIKKAIRGDVILWERDWQIIQKINTRSSTEAELVGASDYVAYTVWITGFLKHQGYKVRNNMFYQDNQSAIKLEKNGKNSASARSKHTGIRFFYQRYNKKGEYKHKTLSHRKHDS